MNLFDPYLDKVPTIQPDENKKRIVLLTSLFVTLKLDLHHQNHLPFSLKSSIIRFLPHVAEQDILDMEMDILMKLQWHVHPPTTEEFLQRFLLVVFPPQDLPGMYAVDLYKKVMSTYLKVFVYGNSQFVQRYPPSSLAAAILMYRTEQQWNHQIQTDTNHNNFSLLTTLASHNIILCQDEVQQCSRHLQTFLVRLSLGFRNSLYQEDKGTTSTTMTNRKRHGGTMTTSSSDRSSPTGPAIRKRKMMLF
jgi:hypothetical protein